MLVRRCILGTEQHTDCAEVSSSSNVQIAWKKRRQIGTGRDAVGGDVRSQLGQAKGGADYEDPETLGMSPFI
jgi:hypothetical protein